MEKADKLLDKLHELYHAESEGVSHAFILTRITKLEEKLERILTALAKLDDAHHELENRSSAFAQRVNEKLRATR